MLFEMKRLDRPPDAKTRRRSRLYSRLLAVVLCVLLFNLPANGGDSDGVFSDGFEDNPGMQIMRIELLWDTPGDPDQTDEVGSDLDLHFRHPSATGWFDEHFDCNWANWNPDWGVVEDPSDDPRMDLDDTDGAGPESISFEGLEQGLMYRVGVHYWDDHDFGLSIPTLRVFWNDALLAELTGESLNGDDFFWEVLDVELVNGSLEISVIDSITPTPP